MKVLFDADALIAINSIKDSLHEKTKMISESLVLEPSEQYVTWDVIDEVATKLRYQVSKKAGLDFLNVIFDGSFKIIFPDFELVQKSIHMYNAVWMKHTSMTDCMNMVVYQQFKMDAIFSFDKGYKKVGMMLLEEVV